MGIFNVKQLEETMGEQKLKKISFRRKGDLFLCVIFATLSLGMLFMCANILDREYSKILSNGFCSDSAVKFETASFPESFLDEVERFEVELTFNSEYDDLELKGVYAGEWYEAPKMESGRFFEKNETRTKKNIVVAGKNAVTNCVIHNKKKYLEINGENYEIIGVISDKVGSRLNSTCFMPMYKAALVTGGAGMYMLDGKNETSVNEAKRELVKSGDQYGCSWESSVAQKKALFDDESERAILIIYITVMFSLVLTGISSIRYWFEYRIEEINTRNILGAYTEENYIWIIRLFLVRIIAAIVAANGIFVLQGRLRKKEVLPVGIQMEIDIIIFLCGILFVTVFFCVETFHKSKKHENIFLTMTYLCVEFVLFYWVFVHGISYYVNLENNSMIKTCKGNYSYYTLFLNSSDSSMSREMEAESEPGYYRNAKNALSILRNSSDYDYLSYSKEWTFGVDAEDIIDSFGKDSYDDFLRGSSYPGFYNGQNSFLKPEIEEIDGISQIKMSFCSMDQMAMKHYNLVVDEGSCFTEDDFNEKKIDDSIPLVLGNAYKPYFDVGDSIRIYVYGEELEGSIIGFLKKDSSIITDLTNETSGYPMVLDYDMVFPYIVYEQMPENENLRALAVESITRQLLGVVAVPENNKNKSDVQIQKDINEIYRENNLFTVLSMSAPSGVALFQSETNQAMNTLALIVAAAVIFDVILLILSMLNVIRHNKRKFAIKLLNGCSYGLLLRDYVLRITVTILISIGIQFALEKELMLQNLEYLLAMLLIGLVITVLTSSFMLAEIYGIDIDKSMETL